nr:MAG TPA: hypothetical protein [Microviridae sp.]
MSWCHLAQYLSSKVLGYCHLKAPCINLFSLSNSYLLSRAHTRTKRARARSRPFRALLFASSQAPYNINLL